MASPPTELSDPTALRSAADIRSYLIAVLSESLKVDPSAIDTGASLVTLGVDSLMALGMAGGLAEWLNRDVPATLMWDYPTVDAIADGLATAKSKPPLPPNIVALQSEGDGVPIFCFPGLPGSPMTFISIASKLDPAQPVYGVAVPGFDGKSDSFTSVEAIARAMLREIRIVSPNGPYRLAGYCFGGLLAFEAAQQLVAVGEKVSLLSIYDAFAPTGRVKRPRWQRPFVHLYLMAIGKSLLKDVVGKLRWSHIKRKLQKATPEFWIETRLCLKTIV